jgi:hypothetical protein
MTRKLIQQALDSHPRQITGSVMDLVINCDGSVMVETPLSDRFDECDGLNSS